MAHAEFLLPSIREALSQVEIALEAVDDSEPEEAQAIHAALLSARTSLQVAAKRASPVRPSMARIVRRGR